MWASISVAGRFCVKFSQNNSDPVEMIGWVAIVSSLFLRLHCQHFLTFGFFHFVKNTVI